ncbi:MULTISPECIES: DMT family transporter [Methylobacterium]|jgi:bacterial/archaeal transporter family-2 protein|uniref:EamA-like transporter family protein n=2 Tax=Methylobacterium TaxID=407 RepID=A0A2R4WM58_9HYPH|nr:MULTISPECIES: DMT family transporter [Methylobacterium]MBZ6411040.1 DMT family transporter [Methylobacterium sp.]AWB22606.1 EamA-like transporter family protein [Methylobacterium currus]MBK3397169.1 DMT family transporter [Methylobacterium ajmalii]MBK3408383.1 DMT family transporter [Methylobacterium ajmalii]MBK3422594.1 DMT family transporter [Methylobacterium ajmalii]
MWYLYGFAMLAGLANAIQPGPNSTLAKSSTQPFFAGLVVVVVSGSALLVAGLVTGRLSLPSHEQAAQVPWWAWCGGVLGAVMTLSQLFIAPKLGAAPFLGTLVTVGVLASIALDHYGLFGFEVHHASIWRVLGGVLMVAGVALVALF